MNKMKIFGIEFGKKKSPAPQNTNTQAPQSMEQAPAPSEPTADTADHSKDQQV
jgi:hypothetical protein